VYVGNLAWSASTDELRNLFGQYGQVEVGVQLTAEDTMYAWIRTPRALSVGCDQG
jgi:RNA recognition motif-containing protein